MASSEHPGSPGWTGLINQRTPRTRQEVLPSRPDLPCPGPEEHLGKLEDLGFSAGRGEGGVEVSSKTFKALPWLHQGSWVAVLTGVTSKQPQDKDLVQTLYVGDDPWRQIRDWKQEQHLV